MNDVAAFIPGTTQRILLTSDAAHEPELAQHATLLRSATAEQVVEELQHTVNRLFEDI